MPYFKPFVYRFFACVMLAALTSCYAAYDDEESPRYTTRPATATSPAIPVGSQSNKPPVAPADATNAPKDQFAPQSNIRKDSENPTPAAEDPRYSVPTKIGEEVQAPTVRVGLLLPMTGASAALGQSLLDAATLAIYDKYNSMASRDITARIELVPEDTGETIEGAEKAAQDALEAGARVLLGPVFGKQVSAVGSLARPSGVPVITFSNNAAVAGEGVYLFGFVPEQQVNRVIQYAISRKFANVAALVPSNPYGATIVKQLSAEMRKTGGRAHPIEYYQENLSSLDVNIGRLSRFLQEQQTTSNQALFVAEGGTKLKSIMDALTTSGITSSKIQLLGTGLWDDTEIGKIPALSGGWFASSPPEKYRSFEQHFNSTYGYKPDRRASLSYDAVALAATLAIAANGGNIPPSLIIDPVGFSGPANGIFRFHEDGTIERGLSVLSIAPGGFKTVDPAPTLFSE